MSDENKDGTTVTITGVKIPWEKIIQYIVLGTGFTVLGVQNTGDQPKPTDPDDRPVTVRQHREHREEEHEFQRDIRRDIRALRDENRKLYEVIYRVHVLEKKKYGMNQK